MSKEYKEAIIEQVKGYGLIMRDIQRETDKPPYPDKAHQLGIWRDRSESKLNQIRLLLGVN